MGNAAEELYNSHMSEADLAHALLKTKGAPVYFGELFEQVMAIKPISGRDRAHIMARIHTELNLDSRFIHVGQGVWSLREWQPAQRLKLNQNEEDLDN